MRGKEEEKSETRGGMKTDERGRGVIELLREEK